MRQLGLLLGKILGNRSLFLAIFLFAVYGCTVSLQVEPPKGPGFGYSQPTNPPVLVTIVDKRAGDDKIFLTGRLSVVLTNVHDEIKFFAEGLEKELKARGVEARVQVSNQESGDIVLRTTKFRMRSYQPTGYNPFTVFTTFRADVSGGGTSLILPSYFVTGRGTGMRLKTAMSLTYRESFDAVIKNVASKLNRHYFKAEVDEKTVEKLMDKIKAEIKEDELACESVYELSFTGSRHAVSFLKELAEKTEERERLKSCAIAALGFHGDPSFLPFLKDYVNTTARKNKLIALEAIGDIGTPEAIDFLKTQRGSEGEVYGRFANEVVDLYTGR